MIVLAAVSCGIAVGCSKSPPQSPTFTTNWMPSVIGGSIAVRELPPAVDVVKSYGDWLAEDPQKMARVYQMALNGNYQSRFSKKVTSGDAPWGNSKTTWVSFLYAHPSKGRYQVQWDRSGEWNTDFLKLGNRSATVWVVPLEIDETTGLPILNVVAFEGVESSRLIAEPGRPNIN